MILCWVWAATRQFPHLATKCNKPLYIERAYHFMNKSFHILINIVSKNGPKFEKYDPKRWNYHAQILLILRTVCFGASGNTSYITDTVNLVSDKLVKNELCLLNPSTFP